MDDVWAAECAPIDMRFEEQGRRVRRQDSPIELFIDLDGEWPGTMVAFGVNPDSQPLTAQASFDEGRGEAVLRSGRRSVLARGEFQAVARLESRHRKRPAYAAIQVAHEEEQVPFQVG